MINEPCTAQHSHELDVGFEILPLMAASAQEFGICVVPGSCDRQPRSVTVVQEWAALHPKPVFSVEAVRIPS